jgi:glycosyltransferase involved in cell wall biosynthesis
MEDIVMKKVAIIYHYLALYRLPIFQEFMESKVCEYTLFSGIESDINIEKINEHLADEPILNGGLRWKFLKNKWFYKKQFLWQKGLLKILLRGDYDSYIFLGSPYFISTWFAVIIARLRNKKVYYWMHGIYRDKLRIMDYFKLFVFYKLANGVFLYGNRAANILKKYKIKNDRNINVVYNSLDYRKCFNIRRKITIFEIKQFRENHFREDVPIVVFIGRLNRVKRIDMLIKAQNLLKTKYEKIFFNIILIGDGEEKENLICQAHNYDLDKNILFTGALYAEENIATLMMYADLCVTPGEIGLTAIHSLSYGTPVISHNNLNIQMPEIESIEEGITGGLYEYNNYEKLAEKIEEWLLINPVKTEATMHNCYKIIDNYYNPSYQAKIFDTILMEE